MDPRYASFPFVLQYQQEQLRLQALQRAGIFPPAPVPPAIVEMSSSLAQPPERTTRDEVSNPVSPVPQPTDATLFEDPADPSKKYYLPRYRLGRVEGAARYRLSFERSGDAWSLWMDLDRLPAPEVAEAARDAAILPHTVSVVLVYQRSLAASGGSMQREHALETAPNEDGTLRCRLQITDLDQRDELVRALEAESYGTQLLVRRTAQLAVPIGEAPPGDAAAGPSYEESTRVFEHVVPPEQFTFSGTTHRYVYAGVADVGADDDDLILRKVRYEEASHRYYQDPRSLSTFFYLPDRFSIMRNPEPPYNPMMRVTVTPQTDGTFEVTLEYRAAPVTDPRRLAVAATQLKAFLPKGAGSDALPEFEPLQVKSESLRFWLTLPREGSTASARQERVDATVDLVGGIADSVTMQLPQFQRVYDAMLGQSSVLFQGQVEVDLGDEQPEVLRFTAQFDDLAGAVLQQASKREGDAYDVTLKNVVESPVKVTGITAVLGNRSAGIPLTIEDLPALPALVQPGESLLLRCAAPPPSAVVPDARVVVDVEASVDPDSTKICEAIFNQNVPAEYERAVKVDGRWILGDQDGEDPVRGVTVHFRNGGAVSLDALTPEATAKVRAPIADLVVRRAQDPAYYYKLTVSRKKSGTSKDESWRSDDSEILVLDLD